MDPILLKKQLAENANDIEEFCKDLQNWGNDMKLKEESLKEKSAPKVKKSPSEGSNLKKSLPEAPNLKKEASKSVTDYSKWEKFDADLECERLDVDSKEDSELTDEFEDSERDKALVYKQKGNSYVKSKNWQKAIESYTTAIACYRYDPIFYANRALCHLKLEQFESAEADCTLSLRLDSTYVKALQRRAAAREFLGKFDAAQSDLELVLVHEPKNAESLRNLEKLRKKLPQKDQRPISKFTASRKPIVTDTILKKSEEIFNQNWPDPGCEILPVKSIEKPAQLRSKKPLKRIKIVDKNEAFKSHIVERTEAESAQKNSEIEAQKIEVAAQKNEEIKPQKIEAFEAQKNKEIKNNENFSKMDQKLVLTAPKTSVQFLSVWKTLKNNSEAKYEYLKLIRASEIPEIFKESLESIIFSDFLRILAENFVKNNDKFYDFLKKLAEVKRFSALTMFMDSSDKNHLWKLIGHLREQKDVSSDEIDRLIELYEL